MFFKLFGAIPCALAMTLFGANAFARPAEAKASEGGTMIRWAARAPDSAPTTHRAGALDAPSGSPILFTTFGAPDSLYIDGGAFVNGPESGDLVEQSIAMPIIVEADSVVRRIDVAAALHGGTDHVLVSLYDEDPATLLQGNLLATWTIDDLPAVIPGQNNCCAQIKTLTSDAGIPLKAGREYWLQMETDPAVPDTSVVWWLSGPYQYEWCLINHGSDWRYCGGPAWTAYQVYGDVTEKLFASGFDYRADLQCSDRIVADCGFEGATQSMSAWSSTDSVLGTPIVWGAPNLKPHLPNAGHWYASFGGTGSASAGHVEQSVTIPASTAATLSFDLWVSDCSDPGDFMSVSLDGNEVLRVLGDPGDPNAQCDASANVTAPDYRRVTVAIPQYADGQAHALNFSYRLTGNAGGTTDFSVDDIDILAP